MFVQAIRKLHGHLKAVKQAAVERKLPQAKAITLTPQEQSLDEDLDEAAQVYFQLLACQSACWRTACAPLATPPMCCILPEGFW